jgi:hypothetical protein
MKNILFLLAIISFGIFALAGCGKTAENTNTAATQNTATKANTAPTKTEGATTSILKPGDVSPDKTVKIVELADSVTADKDAWKGKEVAVSGFVSGTSGSGDHILLTLTSEQLATNKKNVTCAVKGVKTDDVFSKNIEVKGKISHVEDGEYKSISLDPCELKK